MDVVRGIQQGLQFAAEGSTLCLQMPRVQRLFKVQGTILVAGLLLLLFVWVLRIAFRFGEWSVIVRSVELIRGTRSSRYSTKFPEEAAALR